tara:strand:+ start:522 stop:647 length:126 start_codon:yes stop_codon:yes gene_type:complete
VQRVAASDIPAELKECGKGHDFIILDDFLSCGLVKEEKEKG